MLYRRELVLCNSDCCKSSALLTKPVIYLLLKISSRSAINLCKKGLPNQKFGGRHQRSVKRERSGHSVIGPDEKERARAEPSEKLCRMALTENKRIRSISSINSKLNDPYCSTFNCFLQSQQKINYNLVFRINPLCILYFQDKQVSKFYFQPFFKIYFEQNITILKLYMPY